ncbi:hypothetical protein [Oligoflexus tunisiensis]|uniref:hypothetical protein n=1 Tax=Oligoflexus tunisiensis TaxID=708132 RepID=UPI00114C8EE3|nr:hypothetical protein [Oligoflexus tunisiensis]
MNKLSRVLVSLFLASYGLGTSQAAEAHSYSDHFAKLEFLRLKKSGEWLNYIEAGNYVEVEGTRFIGLQAAFSQRRTCLYGFSQAGFDGPGSFAVETRFVCFNTGRYQLNLQKEWCELGTQGCEIDPGGISAGIGNLHVAEPNGIGGGLPFPRPGIFPNSYPSVLTVDVYEPLGPNLPGH